MKTQIIQDHNGIPTGVFIPIKDWEKMKFLYPEIESINDKISQSEKNFIDKRLNEYLKNPEIASDFDEFMQELEQDL